MRNEKGFIYPTMLIVLLLLCYSVVYHIDMYLSEKRYINEQESLLLLESLLQIAVVDFIELWEKEKVVGTRTFSYEHGTVTLVIEEKEALIYVTMSAQIQKGHKRFARFYLNVETNELEEYWEVT